MRSIAFLSLALFATVTFAADPGNKMAGNQAMPEWMKLTMPNENHKALGDLVGKFKYTMKWWAKADAPAEESKGTSQSKWIMKGRFVQQEVKGMAMGQPFNGMGLTGFDNVSQEYQSMWLDDMSTGMMMSNGKLDIASKTLKAEGKMSDAMTGNKNAWNRTELKMISKNEHSYEMYTKDQTGKEFKTMEITYTRTK